MLVSHIDAEPGAQFVVRRVPMFQAAEQLQRALVVVENGKQSNVIRLALQGEKPALLSAILNDIGDEYVRQHNGEQSAAAQAAIRLYERQLGASVERMRSLEQRYARLAAATGAADPGEESRALSQQAMLLQTKLADTMERRGELSGRLGERHPAMEVVDRQIADLSAGLRRIEARRQAMTAAELELAGINREKQVGSEIHAALLSGRNKLDTLLSAEQDQVRLVDRAETPTRPLTLGFPIMAALSCLAGAGFGLLASLIKNAITAHRRERVPQRELRFRPLSMARTEISRAN
jgi:tyrosine-protein kinase Etk/Wzc